MKLLSLIVTTFLIFYPSHSLGMNQNDELNNAIEALKQIWKGYVPENRKQLNPETHAKSQKRYALPTTNDLSISRTVDSPRTKKRKKRNNNVSHETSQQKNTFRARSNTRKLKRHRQNQNLQDQQLSSEKKDALSELLRKKYDASNVDDVGKILESFCRNNRIGECFEQLDETHYIRYSRSSYSIEIVNDQLTSKLFEDYLQKKQSRTHIATDKTIKKYVR